MIPHTKFNRNEKKRQFCINVYLIVAPTHEKIRSKIKYNRSKYRLYIIKVSKATDLNSIKKQGYDGRIDKIYVLSEPDVDKYIKKKPSLLNAAIMVYSEESCIKELNDKLQ